ncbi:MAG: TatD family hydrolase [Candidatus Eisenbacteria bacterium]|uniref:TatD family hydrolase n=1 Tax=Eiseniibacteriota bacterium TaxID=2212470 RepID=A0A9D6QP25_UNCEI|nr:TatD family hydrolase [Candidatus Eisenbacteria bacterium]MBI3539514.1 TatD family hydrolase [Candidatus Eisenbacteria bacterium]
MIDTHCHLCDRRFDKDRVHVLDRARHSGVTHLIEIAYAPEIVPRAHDLAREHANVYLAVGVHPGESGRVGDDYLAALRDHARHPRVVAIGETGLDFYRDHAPRADQERWFRAQVRLADELGLPVVIHQRSALEETLAILETMRPAAGGVLHCFDDGPAAVERAAAIGFKLGIGGVLTYGHAPLEEAVRTAPAEMLVLETDAPYLEPEPRSLRRNEPGLLARIVPRLAELRGWTAADVDRITTANARDLFRAPPGGPA